MTYQYCNSSISPMNTLSGLSDDSQIDLILKVFHQELDQVNDRINDGMPLELSQSEKKSVQIVEEARRKAKAIIETAKDEAKGIIKTAKKKANEIDIKAHRTCIIKEARWKARKHFLTRQIEARTRMKQIREENTRKMEEITSRLLEYRYQLLDTKLNNTDQDSERLDPIIKLNVGGVKHHVSKSTLTKEESMLSVMFNGRFRPKPDKKGYHFIDRDGYLFRHILNHLRGFKTVSEDECEAVLHEAKYYQLESLIKQLKNTVEHSD